MKNIKIKFVLSMLLTSVILLTGCSCKHEKWNDATCTKPKTCAECGVTEGEPLGHDWSEADCENPKTCKACGETDGEPLEHKWKDATCDKPKTCELCGKTEGEPLEHKWKDADCENPKTCELCGKTEGKAKGHKYDESKICTEDTKCEVCGKTIPAAGHKWTDATCTEPKKCSVCGETEGEALGHTTSNGKCSRCGEEIKLQVLMYSDSNLDIYYTGLSEGSLNDACINFYAVNKSSNSWTIQVRDESVNGSMMDFTCSSNVAAGENIHDDMSCSYSLYLNDIGVYSIDDIKSIEFYLHIYDDNHNDYDTGIISIDAKNNTVNQRENSEIPSKENSQTTKSLNDMVTFLNEKVIYTLSNLIEDDDIEVTYEMKSDYYQVTVYMPDLEGYYHYSSEQYYSLMDSYKELSRILKAYLDANGYSEYHAYVDVGSDPPVGKENEFEKVLICEFRDGEIGIDATKNTYGN